MLRIPEPGSEPGSSAGAGRRPVVWKALAVLLLIGAVAVAWMQSPAEETPLEEPSTTLGPFPPSPVDTDRFDITLGLNPTELSDAELAQALDLAQDAGVTQIQSGANWWWLNRGREPREYDWRDLDRLFAATEERGIRVKLQLSGTPGWVHGEDEDTPPSLDTIWNPPVRSEEQLGHWGDFVADVVGRYGDRVTFYELWNEPNSEVYWKPEPSPREFAALLRTGYLRAKDQDPDVVIGSGGLSRNDIGYLETLYEELRDRYEDAEANGHFFDILGVHPYSREQGPAEVSDSLISTSRFGLIDENYIGFTRMREVLQQYGDHETPIHLGEYGFSTTETWMEAVPEETRARYLREAYAIAMRFPYIIGLTWYDFLPDGSGEGWEIVGEDGRPLATFDALREVEVDDENRLDPPD